MNKREKLICLSIELEGDWLSMYEVLKRDPGLLGWEPQGPYVPVQAVTVFDDDYPQVFLSFRMPPFVLFYEGDLGLLTDGMTAVAGSYSPSGYGRSYAKNLQRRPVAAVLDHGIASLVLSDGIGIAPNGLLNPFSEALGQLSERLSQRGLVISEFGPEVSFSWRRYWRATSLLLSLCECLLVFELEAKDVRLGLMATFLDHGLPIFVLPDRWDSSRSAGGLSLLDKGASFMDGSIFLNND